MSIVRRCFILVHRYLGIILAPLFILWFLSGIGMMYTGGMPGLTPQSRLEHLTELDLEAIRLAPDAAAQRVGVSPSTRVTLLTVLGRPAYRFGGRGQVTVFADTGEVLGEVARGDAVATATTFMNVSPDQVRYDGILSDPDQWTLTVRGNLPLHKLTIDDPAHTQLYISVATAEVGMLTTRRSRALAWVAAIPHWLYFTPLRVQQQVWTRTILWTAGAGCVLALLGLVLGVWQFRFSPPFSLSRLPRWIPYRGWMRWHYITGAVFGVFTLTWVFSGLLSMEPFGWASGGGLGTRPLEQALSGGNPGVDDFPAIDAATWSPITETYSIREIEYALIQGAPHFVVSAVSRDSSPRTAPLRLLVEAGNLNIRTRPFSVESLVDLAERTYPNVEILDASLLNEYDGYYYAREGAAPLPVLRVKFNDPDHTWFYIDPATSRLMRSAHKLDRLERWIYNGFHSLDFGFWYNSRPAWDIGVIFLSLGGMASTTIGLYVGIRRLLGLRRSRGLVRPSSSY